MVFVWLAFFLVHLEILDFWNAQIQEIPCIRINHHSQPANHHQLFVVGLSRPRTPLPSSVWRLKSAFHLVPYRNSAQYQYQIIPYQTPESNECFAECFLKDAHLEYAFLMHDFRKPFFQQPGNLKSPQTRRQLLKKDWRISSSVQEKRNGRGWCWPSRKVRWVENLLDDGISPNLMRESFEVYLLIFASEIGSLETVKLLIEQGARINDSDSEGRTALFMPQRMDTPKLFPFWLKMVPIPMRSVFRIAPHWCRQQWTNISKGWKFCQEWGQCGSSESFWLNGSDVRRTEWRSGFSQETAPSWCWNQYCLKKWLHRAFHGSSERAWKVGESIAASGEVNQKKKH